MASHALDFAEKQVHEFMYVLHVLMTRQAVTKHLVTLTEAGLLTVQEEGRERQYVPQPATLQAVTAWIEAVEARCDQRLAALHTYLLHEPKQDPSHEGSEQNG